jgi:uncharacterized protein YkwD
VALLLGAVGVSGGEARAGGLGRGATARNAVLGSYAEEFIRTQPASEWSGDVTRCQAGSTSAAFQQSILRRVNWYRQIAGLAGVTYDSSRAQDAQMAALIQSASGYLTHTPSASQPCWTNQGATASARSNLALGVYGAGAIDGYMEDAGDYNTGAGHRWWILSPRLGGVAFGDVPATAEHSGANAMWVTNSNTPVSARDGYIAWPAAGTFPDVLAPARWSFDINLPGDTYTNASVTVAGPQGPVPVKIVNREAWLVWEMPQSLDVSADATYAVTITGVGAAGAAPTGASYSVTLVDANRPPVMTASIGYGRSTCAGIGSAVGGGVFEDDRASDLTVELVPGDGSNDNAKFTAEPGSDGSVVLLVAEDLPLRQVKYSTRVRVADADGAFSENEIRFGVVDAGFSDQPCPARNLAITETSSRNGWVTMTWDPPVTGPDVTYKVSRSGVIVCSSSATICQANLGAGSHTLRVISVAESGQTAVSQPSSVTLSVSVPVVKPGFAGGSRVKTSTLLRLPAGTRKWSLSGPCAISKDKVWVRFGTRSGVCRIKVTGRRRVGAKTVAKTVSASLPVRWPA